MGESLSTMLLLTLFVAGAAASFVFPSASYRRESDRKTNNSFPDAIGFFVENRVNKIGIDLFELLDFSYAAFDCTGTPLSIIRRGEVMINYECTTFKIFDAKAFSLNATLVHKKQTVTVSGLFSDDGYSVRLMKNGETQEYAIEKQERFKYTFRASFKFTRGLYQQKYFLRPLKGVPRQIGLHFENGKNKIAIDINNFYFLYTCDSQSHFYYENGRLISRYFCSAFKTTHSSYFLGLVYGHGSQEDGFFGEIIGRKILLNFNNIHNITYESTSTGITDPVTTTTTTTSTTSTTTSPTTTPSPRPAVIFPEAKLYPAVDSRSLVFPPRVHSYTVNGKARMIIDIEEYPNIITCDGVTRLTYADNLYVGKYQCNVKKDNHPKRTEFSLKFTFRDNIYSFIGVFYLDVPSLFLKDTSTGRTRYYVTKSL